MLKKTSKTNWKSTNKTKYLAGLFIQLIYLISKLNTTIKVHIKHSKNNNDIKQGNGLVYIIV